MPKAVQFDSFGGIEVLQVREVRRPVPDAGEVLVKVKAAAMNPSEAIMRTGAVREIFPTTFPSGQGRMKQIQGTRSGIGSEAHLSNRRAIYAKTLGSEFPFFVVFETVF